MTNAEIIALTQNNIVDTYTRFPVAIVKGRGTRLWDANGREYLDFVSGIAVCNTGHNHPKVVAAIQAQAENLLHVSNLYNIEPQAKLGALLNANSFADRVFFCNSGSEANEAAIKLSRKYFSSRGDDRFQIITMKKSFHGRTFATLSATGQQKVQVGFEPLLETFAYAPFNDINAVEALITDRTAAILTEPIQGEGGVNLPDADYLKGLRRLCDENGLLLIFDEVQVGAGRTGKLFAYENYGVEPDIMTLAKGLGGGVAIGAMLATEQVAAALTPGTHGSTFGGNPLATAAAYAAVKAILEEGMLDNCKKVGAYLHDRLGGLREKYSFVKEVRGKGLILGVEIEVPAAPIVTGCLERGLLILSAGEFVLRFLPALIVTEAEVDEMMAVLTAVLDEVEQARG